MIYSNRSFREMWSIPDGVAEEGDVSNALPHALRQLVDPDSFASKVRELHLEPDAESREEARLLDGRVFERSSRPLVEEGEIVGRVWSFFDVTDERRAEKERRRLEQRMQQAQKMESLGILAGGIAHDFNNLLVGILGNADLLLMTTPPDAASRGPLKDILDSSQRASELTNQMLAYSGKGSFVVSSIDLAQLVHDTGHLLEAVISKNASMELLLDEVPPVEGDATQLRQVVMNLITNASDALDGERGDVRVTTRLIEADAGDLAGYHFGDALSEGAYVCIEVSDSGCGMDDETAARIFDPFFTTKFTGRGLGLAAVLGIVRAHRGAIQVESKPGRGTTFRLLLPPSSRRPSESESPMEADPKRWLGSGTILVVDDEPSIRRLVGRALERAGFDVLEAKSGREALDLFPEHAARIVAILLDLTMPDLGGEETFTALRELGADVPIVLCSGYSESEVRAGFEGAGPSEFLHKPFTAVTMLAVLRRVLDAPS
jgi:two-component system cell cycle sensor histidine kinase/response regulator CckA